MSYQQGLSGLNAASANLSTIGNNVANSNTVGFKQSQAQFADMFSQSLSSGGTGQVGTGVRVAAIAQQFTQGSITATTNPLDTAINGAGFFQMVDTNGTTVYSRNGQFSLDKNGYLVNAQSSKVNGYMPNATGKILTGAVVPIQINPANLPPVASSTAVVGVNLNSAAAVPATATFNPTDPTSYTNSTSMTVFDSLGGSHIGTMYFDMQPVAPTTASATGTQPLGVISAAATTADLASVAGLSVGNTLTIPGAGVAGSALIVTISGVTTATAPAGTVTFTPATTTATAAGANITTNAPSATWNSYLTVDGNMVPTVAPTTDTLGTTAPASSATLASVAGLTVGSTLTLGTNTGLTISGIAGSVVTFTPPTTTSTAANDVVTAVTPLSQMVFNTSGTLLSTTSGGVASATLGTVTSSTLFPNSSTVNTGQTVAFNFNSLTSPSSQYGSAFSVNALTQNGYTTGQLNSTKTGVDGTITGTYSNGQTRSLAQIVTANFTDVQGLGSIGNNAWVETSASGQPLVSVPGTGSLGTLQASATEDSNVDLTAALVKMITAQRAYQANAQTIKTEDSIMQTVINLR